MPTRTLEELRSMVGTSARTAEGLRIEAGKVAEFAAAIGDESPIYRDAAVARERGYEAIPAPLTFTRTAEFPRYRPAEFVEPRGFGLGLDPTTTLHGEQSYEYHAPAVVGDVLSATATLTDVRRHEGDRGGEMTFAEIEQVFEDRTGRPIVTVRSTYIETEGAEVLDESSGSRDTEPPDAEADLRLISEELDRTDFVEYAGASGDFTPLHFDEPYARSCGFETVFAQGMLTAGTASRVLTDRFGVGAVRRYRTRFEDIVFPGESVVVRGTVTGERSDVGTPLVDVELTAATRDGRRVLSGSATAVAEGES
jgi:acyl dehydratase